MKKLAICTIGVMFLALSIISTHSIAQQTGQAPDPKELFEKKCSACHSIDKPKSKQKTQQDWTKTVMRMKNKKNALFNDDEAKVIIEYLAKNYGK